MGHHLPGLVVGIITSHWSSARGVPLSSWTSRSIWPRPQVHTLGLSPPQLPLHSLALGQLGVRGQSDEVGLKPHDHSSRPAPGAEGTEPEPLTLLPRPSQHPLQEVQWCRTVVPRHVDP